MREELEKKDEIEQKRTGAKGPAPGDDTWVWLTSYSRVPVSKKYYWNKKMVFMPSSNDSLNWQFENINIDGAAYIIFVILNCFSIFFSIRLFKVFVRLHKITVHLVYKDPKVQLAYQVPKEIKEITERQGHLGKLVL